MQDRLFAPSGITIPTCLNFLRQGEEGMTDPTARANSEGSDPVRQRPGILAVDLRALKAPLQAWAAKHRQSAGAVVYDLVARFLGQQGAFPATGDLFDGQGVVGPELVQQQAPAALALPPGDLVASVPAPQRPYRPAPGAIERSTVRLPPVRVMPSERGALEAEAKRLGFSPSRLVAALLRAHLTRIAPLGDDAELSLATSNQRLLAIGRNLNQAVRLMHETGQVTDIAPEVAELTVEIRAHVRQVAAVLERNSARWGLAPADK